MDIERHARLTALFEELVVLPPGSEREARIREMCGEDSELRAELEGLLRFDAEPDDLAPGAELRTDLERLWEQDGAKLEDLDAEEPRRYEIQHLLGEGGFGSVYLARELEPFPRQVAIKVIKPGMDTREVLARFDSERRALASMDHPGIARAYTAGTDQRGRPYFVMEYVDGQMITTFCDEQRLDIRRRLELFVEVCEAIQHAHFKGIVHRDIKPANVLVTTVDGRPSPKTIDFGVAKALEQEEEGASLLTREGQLIGTLVAMSPEQALGAPVDTRADVYALGGLLYELICGSPPFSCEAGTDFVELRRQVVEVDPPRPSVRALAAAGQSPASANPRSVSPSTLARLLADDLDWIVMRALEKEPARRYASPSELAADLQRYLSDEPVLARPPSRSYQASKFARRHKAGLVVASTIMVLLVVGSIGTMVGWTRSVRSLKIARAAEADALAINAFMNDNLLSTVSPESMGFDVPMRQVLDAAASRIGTQFEESPRVERAIRTTLGRTYRALGLPKPATVQLEAALALAVPGAMAGEEAVAAAEREIRERSLLKYELGRVHLLENRNAEAESVLRDLWEECSTVLGPEDPLSIDAQHFLGVSLAEQGSFAEASQVFDANRNQALAVFGPEHELSIQALHSQGLLCLSREGAEHEEREETIPLLEQALQASRNHHGSDDPRTVRRIVDLASALDERGRLPEALTLSAAAHERSARVQGPMHPTTATAAMGIAVCHLHGGSPDLASPSIEEALVIATGLGEQHPLLNNVRSLIAFCRIQQKRWAEAEEFALALYSTSEGIPQQRFYAARLLATICERDGRPDEAQHWAEVVDRLAAEHDD